MSGYPIQLHLFRKVASDLDAGISNAMPAIECTDIQCLELSRCETTGVGPTELQAPQATKTTRLDSFVVPGKSRALKPTRNPLGDLYSSDLYSSDLGSSDLCSSDLCSSVTQKIPHSDLRSAKKRGSSPDLIPVARRTATSGVPLPEAARPSGNPLAKAPRAAELSRSMAGSKQKNQAGKSLEEALADWDPAAFHAGVLPRKPIKSTQQVESGFRSIEISRLWEPMVFVAGLAAALSCAWLAA